MIIWIAKSEVRIDESQTNQAINDPIIFKLEADQAEFSNNQHHYFPLPKYHIDTSNKQVNTPS